MLRVWVVKICAGMVLIASANSNGDKGAPSTVSALSEAGPRALPVVTVGLFGAALANAHDEPTQDRASKKAGEPSETEEAAFTSESSSTTTDISAGS